jgi:hypothetical protein
MSDAGAIDTTWVVSLCRASCDATTENGRGFAELMITLGLSNRSLRSPSR